MWKRECFSTSNQVTMQVLPCRSCTGYQLQQGQLQSTDMSFSSEVTAEPHASVHYRSNDANTRKQSSLPASVNGKVSRVSRVKRVSSGCCPFIALILLVV